MAEGQRGFEVAPVSAADFKQVAELRLLLENHALEQSFTSGDLDWEGRVVSAHHKLGVMEKRMLQGSRENQELWKQCDWDFHHSLISACGSDVLLAAHAAAYDRYLRYQMIAVVFRGEIAAREHQALLEAALIRDWKQAQTIMVSHIRGCVEHALREDHAGLFGSPANGLRAGTNRRFPQRDRNQNRRARRQNQVLARGVRFDPHRCGQSRGLSANRAHGVRP